MKQKRLISLLCASAMAMMLFTGCSSSGTTNKETTKSETESKDEKKDEWTIGFAQCDLTDTWESYYTEAVEDAAEKAGATILVTDAGNDSNQQLSDIETLISKGADVIITVLVDTSTAESAISACKEADVPLIGAVRQFDGCDAFVGVDFTAMAQDQAKQLADKIGGSGKIGLLMGTMGNDDQIKRTEGNKDALKEYPDIEIVMEDSAEWDRAKAQDIVENWLQTGYEFDGILCNNDEMAIGAILALDGEGLADKVVVAGVDGTQESLPYVKEGKLDITYFFNPFSLADTTVDYAQKLAGGEQIADDKKVNLGELEMITKDNYETYMGYWGMDPADY